MFDTGDVGHLSDLAAKYFKATTIFLLRYPASNKQWELILSYSIITID